VSEWELTIGASDEWYTPRYIFDALAVRFDLDVAAPINGPRDVPTSSWFSSGALDREWAGFVWMNPLLEAATALSPGCQVHRLRQRDRPRPRSNLRTLVSARRGHFALS
jgi:hypothetical protein